MHGTPHIVGDVMRRSLLAVRRTTPFREIVRIMRDRRVSALPVLGGGRVLGLVSATDLLPKEEFREGPLDGRERLSDATKADGTTARDLMTSPAFTVGPDTTLAAAARTMSLERIKHLPVVDEQGVLVGIVSRADLLKVFLRDDEEIAEEVRREVVSYLFPAPRSTVWVQVHGGVVTVKGRIGDPDRIPVAARLARAVEGVVAVKFALAEDTRRHRVLNGHGAGPVTVHHEVGGPSRP
ncbi:CBS domain-containing protein [Streptomyces flavofungini]|uniref:CBS domain-containing protein n=1 Tax=Streptomyces flavofungini TaxID=68200 RepID=A0ABS0XHI5_9ACTN|nr:CBS domain-containing protein [Streptomyces flavofungini]MBJ3812692.1 CBS domain-containing protein [Streptomyces flavofungini]